MISVIVRLVSLGDIEVSAGPVDGHLSREGAGNGAGLLLRQTAIGADGEYYDGAAVMVDDIQIFSVRRRDIGDWIRTSCGVRGRGQRDESADLTIYLEDIDLARVLLGRGDVHKINRVAGTAGNSAESETK